MRSMAANSSRAFDRDPLDQRTPIHVPYPMPHEMPRCLQNKIKVSPTWEMFRDFAPL